MKKLLTSAILLCSALAAMAVPAKRGQWQTIALNGGGTARVQLIGDEYLHWLQSEDGTRYALDEQTGLYAPLSDSDFTSRQGRAAVRRAATTQTIRRTAAKRAKDKAIFQGTKKALVIFAEFANTAFAEGHDLDYYKNVVNGIGYSDNEYFGSVRDYFRAQSGGVFDIDFDVVGPCPLAKNRSYYGKNDYSGNDAHAGEMVAEACLWAHEQGIDFSQYDWDGDGEVDQVFVLYAGKGEADGGSTSTIWPHMFNLKQSDYGKRILLDGVYVNTYACSCELNGSSGANGIGTFCHEFSHCMGFPDLYDTMYTYKWATMGSYDLMDMGSYNGSGFIPTGYSAYEKNECGWITMHDMTDVTEDVTVEGLKPISEGGDAYVIRNKGNEDERYIVELRRNTGWDSSLPGEGVMITHLDFDQAAWDNNCPNTYTSYYSSYKEDIVMNDHPRLMIFRANNSSSNNYNMPDALYPSSYGNNELTHTSAPAAVVYTKNADGTKYMHVDITDITTSSDFSEASLTFGPARVEDPSQGETLFYESFDKCDGKGGNDDEWKGNAVAKGTPLYDNEGWTSDTGGIFGAYQCIKLGTSTSTGSAITPEFTVNGTARLSFRAGAWDSSRDDTKLNVTIAQGVGSVENGEFDMLKGAWGEYATTITGNGAIKISFEALSGRFFLDDVLVTSDTSTGISTATAGDGHGRVTGYYTVGGMRLSAPQKGINIVRYADGTSRKVVM